ncbi:MAG: FAD-binding oxidoreductase, partial [Deltaproteobacteria bacterium]
MDDTRKRSFWGWGWEDKFPDATARKAVGEHAQHMVGFAPERCDEPPSLESIELRAPRLSAPSILEGFVTGEHEARVRHTYGRSYRDVLRGFRGDFAPAPDLVATP